MGAIVQIARVDIEEEKLTPLQKIFFYTHLVTKSFLIAILILMIVISLFLVIYFGDILYNVKRGNYKSPLFSAYVIVSPSMVPTIKVNDAIIIKRVKAESLKLGDIITFKNDELNVDGYTITHRIVGKQLSTTGELIFRTKGDNNNVEDDGLVRPNDVYGKVILKIPKLGYIQQFVSKPSGFLICILVPTIILIVSDGLRIVWALKKKKRLA